jgi:hypothetical protein
MTPRFKEMIKAGVWFTVGFLTHFALIYFHHHL